MGVEGNCGVAPAVEPLFCVRNVLLDLVDHRAVDGALRRSGEYLAKAEAKA